MRDKTREAKQVVVRSVEIVGVVERKSLEGEAEDLREMYPRERARKLGPQHALAGWRQEEVRGLVTGDEKGRSARLAKSEAQVTDSAQVHLSGDTQLSNRHHKRFDFPVA